MGNICGSSSSNDVDLNNIYDINLDYSSHLSFDISTHSNTSGGEKFRVEKSSSILILGDRPLKLSTAKWLGDLLNLSNSYCNNQNLASSSLDSLENKDEYESQKDIDIKGENDVEVYVVTTFPSNRLIEKGVKFLTGALRDPSSILTALIESKADAVFIVSPVRVDGTQLTISSISACKRAGVGHVVLLSLICSQRDESTLFGDQCKIIEKYLIKSGLSYTIVRIPLLLDNYLFELNHTSEKFRRVFTPDSERSSVAICDVGEAVGKILLSPSLYADKIITLSGYVSTCLTSADAFSIAFNRPIIYEQISYEEYEACLLGHGMSTWHVNGLLELFQISDEMESYCKDSLSNLEDLLDHPATNIYSIAVSYVAELAEFEYNTSDSKSSNNGDYFPILIPNPIVVDNILDTTLSISSSLNIAGKIKIKKNVHWNDNIQEIYLF
jgi:uncharacterized protein YbjT (DUF2867 family)